MSLDVRDIEWELLPYNFQIRLPQEGNRVLRVLDIWVLGAKDSPAALAWQEVEVPYQSDPD